MKLSKSTFITTAAFTLSMSFSALADKGAGEVTDDISKAWTDCGIGAMIIKDQPVAAAIINVLTSLGTPAVISFYASPETCKGVNVGAASFINESLDSIESDLAKGEGLHATAMLALMGCSENQHANVTKAIRSELANFESFTSLSHDKKAQKIYTVTADKVSACQIS